MSKPGAPKPVPGMGREDGAPNPMPEIILARSQVADTLCMVTAPLQLLTGWYVVEPRTEIIVAHFGVVSERVAVPGLHWGNSCGRQIYSVSTAQSSLQINNANVLDSQGNPIVVSAVV